MDNLISALRAEIPVKLVTYHAPAQVGLVIIDEVNGFCTVGKGNLAPAKQSPQIDQMVDETDGLAELFVSANWPVLVLRDTHVPERPEPPYPPHCIIGTGEEILVDRLRWLETSAENGRDVWFINKDCINGVVGGLRKLEGTTALYNLVFDWINVNRLEAVIVVGICTDICDMDFVNTLLSARNHAVNGYEKPSTMLLPTLKDVVVFEPGCATYDLPLETAKAMGSPEASHPAEIMHHIGLKVMASRGAILADKIVMPDGTTFSLD